jgi:hypothetical protein
VVPQANEKFAAIASKPSAAPSEASDNRNTDVGINISQITTSKKQFVHISLFAEKNITYRTNITITRRSNGTCLDIVFK